ncbi:hypothetical protein D3C80_1331010 [compost metagenome]
MVALEQLDHVQAGDDFIAVWLEFVPAIGGERIARQRNSPQANEQGQGGIRYEMLHADSTWGQLITHIRPSLNSPAPREPVA